MLRLPTSSLSKPWIWQCSHWNSLDVKNMQHPRKGLKCRRKGNANSVINTNAKRAARKCNDQILSRHKSHNPMALLSFSCTEHPRSAKSHVAPVSWGNTTCNAANLHWVLACLNLLWYQLNFSVSNFQNFQNPWWISIANCKCSCRNHRWFTVECWRWRNFHASKGKWCRNYTTSQRPTY